MRDHLITRRQFLEGLGAGMLGAAAVSRGAGRLAARDAAASRRAGPMAHYVSAPGLHPPVLDVTKADPDAATSLLFLAPKGGPGQYGPMIADVSGQPVWLHPLSGPWRGAKSAQERRAEVANNFRVSQYKDKPVLTWWQGQLGYGASQYVVADDRYRQIATFTAGNGLRGDQHEFVIAPDGTALITFYESVPANLSSVGGPTHGGLLDCGFQRLDIATGDVVFQWRASDYIAFWESYRPMTGQGSPETPWDFFHINSVELDTDGNYLISARHTWGVYKINRSSGAVMWRLGGKRSNFRLGRRARFSWQHDARAYPGGVLSLFDDGAGVYRTAQRSRGLILSLDETAMTAHMAEQYLLPGDVLAWSQGSTQILPDGNVVVGWGSEPFVSEYTHDGRLIFDAHLPLKSQSYRAFRFPWTGRPATRPGIVAEAGIGPPRIFASWNGATEVATWQVLAGRREHHLRPIQRARRNGFETVVFAVNADTSDRYFAVAALDAGGRVLGRSKAVRPRRNLGPIGPEFNGSTL